MPSTASTTSSLKTLAGSALAVFAVAGAAGLGGCASTGERSQNVGLTGGLDPSTIDGRAIVVLCDADLSPTAMVDGRLSGGAGPKGIDQLTSIGLPIADAPDEKSSKWMTAVGQVPVSNSAHGPAAAVAASPVGGLVYVVEAFKPAVAGQSSVEQLAKGTLMTCVDVSAPQSPRVVAALDVGTAPVAVDVSADGAFIAIATQTPGEQIVVVRAADFTAGGSTSSGAERMAWPLMGVGGTSVGRTGVGRTGGSGSGATASEGAPAVLTHKPSSICWHPSGRYLAVTIPETNQIAFYEFDPEGAGPNLPGLAAWGAPVTVGKFPFSGRFSKDGKHFIFTELQWGADVEGFMTGAPEGRVGVIRLSAVATATSSEGAAEVPAVMHEVLKSVQVGISPEAMALSPTGNMIVTGNLKRAFLPAGDERLTPGGSLSLVSFDPATGELRVLNELPINGMPKGVAFDATGKHVIVSEFRSFDPQNTEGELGFYRLGGFGATELQFCGFHVAVGNGPHSIVVVK